ncbi:helix-turn-helix domain-containing protein [Lachnospiraceae bacterium NSJ-143]|nr:helix-turn-helix domain-containing protein [Lachnospiraceae bacterium NSJ-143]
MENKIGEKVRSLREAKGWSQRELGLKIGLKQSNIGNIESGKNKMNKMAVVEQLLDVFNISFDFLFADVLVASNSRTESDFIQAVKLELVQMDGKELKLSDEIIYLYLKSIRSYHTKSR